MVSGLKAIASHFLSVIGVGWRGMVFRAWGLGCLEWCC